MKTFPEFVTVCYACQQPTTICCYPLCTDLFFLLIASDTFSAYKNFYRKYAKRDEKHIYSINEDLWLKEEKEMATHSSILAWRIPWTEEPGGLQSMGSQRVRYD